MVEVTFQVLALLKSILDESGLFRDHNPYLSGPDSWDMHDTMGTETETGV